jgi:alkylation response protein AidB-like acyl-CoA dehydrogenase
VDFTLSTEESILRDSAERFTAAEYELARRNKLIAADQDHWERFVELGWLGLGIPEEAGGYDASLNGPMVLAEALGQGLALEPYLGVGVLAPHAILAAAGAEAAAALLAPVIEGQERLALAHAEHEGRGRHSFVRTSARRQGDGYILSGAKSAVLGGSRATKFVVAARTSGAVDEDEGVSLFLVDRDAPGLTVQPYRLIDASPVADLELNGVAARASALIGVEGKALSALEFATDVATVAAAFSTVGAMGAALTQTRDYLQTRKQFGDTLSQFQALRHRAADMLVSLEQARSAAFRGLAGLHADDPGQRRRAVSAMKIVVARCSHFVCGQAIQLHGGMGVTDELRIGHLFKHATVANALFGSPDFHVRRLGALL